MTQYGAATPRHHPLVMFSLEPQHQFSGLGALGC
jgi:hypothetical protein